MASVALLRWPAIEPVVREGKVEWQRRDGSSELPVIFFVDGAGWSEANLWAQHQASTSDPRTVQRNIEHLCAYAKWLEAEGLTWWHFPVRERDRCLVRFRGALIAARDRGELAPSTVSQRMASIVRFYRWVRATGLFTPDWPMWEERQIALRLENAMGLEHTLRVRTTNLAIPNRKAEGVLAPEDGLMPVTGHQMRKIMELAVSAASEELALMLRLGFGTGMRLGSIYGLQIDTLVNAQPCPLLGEAGWFRLSIGPGAKPPVPTKFGVSGTVLIARELLEEVRAYAFSTRRLKRQAKAVPDYRQFLFLTRFGNPYGGRNSRAINVEMSRLRDAGRNAEVPVLREFHFHRTRATFLSQLMHATLSCLPVGDAIEFVRDAALHRHEATTLKYVKFVETSKAMADGANAFTRAFLGLKNQK